MSNLRTFENKLRDYLTRNIKNSGDVSILLRRYNNLRFSMNFERYNRPHVIIRIGISEAAFDIDTGIILSGGLGQDANEIKKWFNNFLKKNELKAVWQIEYKKFLSTKDKENETASKKKNNQQTDNFNNFNFFN